VKLTAGRPPLRKKFLTFPFLGVKLFMSSCLAFRNVLALSAVLQIQATSSASTEHQSLGSEARGTTAAVKM
jgi:hypothetical protein